MPNVNFAFSRTIDSTEKPGYAARLIAYLSATMLAAAVGSTLGENWGRLWFIFGVFGLVSSVGLYLISLSRARSESLRKKNELARQAEKHLKKIVVVEESFDEISEAVRRIQGSALGREKPLEKK